MVFHLLTLTNLDHEAGEVVPLEFPKFRFNDVLSHVEELDRQINLVLELYLISLGRDVNEFNDDHHALQIHVDDEYDLHFTVHVSLIHDVHLDYSKLH